MSTALEPIDHQPFTDKPANKGPSMSHESAMFSGLKRCAFAMVTGMVLATSVLTAARATEPAQDENLAYTIGVQTYISYFPLMDLYRTLWETSFDPGRGHDRTLNEYFVFDRLITSKDDWVITPNNDTIYLRAFLDLRKEPIILVIPPMGDRQYWVPVGDMWHDFDANLSWDIVGSRGGAFALCAPGWQGVLPEGGPDDFVKAFRAAMDAGKHTVDPVLTNYKSKYAVDWAPFLNRKWTDAADTALPLAEIKRLAERITTVPGNFKASLPDVAVTD